MVGGVETLAKGSWMTGEIETLAKGSWLNGESCPVPFSKDSLGFSSWQFVKFPWRSGTIMIEFMVEMTASKPMSHTGVRR